jgi:hypothetical protein
VLPASGGGLAAGGGLDEKKLELEKMLELLEQPPSKAAVVPSKPASVRRRDGVAAAARTCNSADNTVLPDLGLRNPHRSIAIRHIGGESLTEWKG